MTTNRTTWFAAVMYRLEEISKSVLCKPVLRTTRVCKHAGETENCVSVEKSPNEDKY